MSSTIVIDLTSPENVNKPRCCRLCKQPGHNITNCKNTSIKESIDKLDTHVIDIVPFIVNHLHENNHNDPANVEELDIFINGTVEQWLSLLRVPLLAAICLKYGMKTSLLRTDYVTALKRVYHRLILDASYFELGEMTFSAMNYIARRFIRLILPRFNTLNGILAGMQQIRFFEREIHSPFWNTILQHVSENTVLFRLTESSIRRLNEIRVVFENLQAIYNATVSNNTIAQPAEPAWKIHTTILCLETSKQLLEEVECPICYEPCKTIDTVTTQCGHVYCSSCIKGTVKSNETKMTPPPCPMCRSEIKILEMKCPDILFNFENEFSKITC